GLGGIEDCEPVCSSPPALRWPRSEASPRVSVRALSSSGTSCSTSMSGEMRGEVARGGQPERPIARAERNDGLHRALAERARADDRRAPVILERTRHDFRGRGRTAVDQHDDRLVLGEVARARVEPLGFLGIAAARRHDLALLQERIGDRDRLIEQSARIVAQVDDKALELVAGLGGEAGDRLFQALGGLLVELGDADKTDVVAFEARTYRAHLNARAGDGDLDRLVLALADDLE